MIACGALTLRKEGAKRVTPWVVVHKGEGEDYRIRICHDSSVFLNGNLPDKPFTLPRFTEARHLGSEEDWTKEVLDLEKAGVCTKDSWTHIWNDPEGAHKDFPAKH